MGSVLYEKVFSHIDVIETEYFGLQFTDEYNVNVSTRQSRHIVDNHDYYLLSSVRLFISISLPICP